MLYFQFGWFAHPIFTEEGGYPAAMIENVAQQSLAEGLPKSRLEQFDQYWIQRIKGTSDFLGINHYTTHLVTGAGVDPIAKHPSWLKDIGAITSMKVGGDSASEWLRVTLFCLFTYTFGMQAKFPMKKKITIDYYLHLVINSQLSNTVMPSKL